MKLQINGQEKEISATTVAELVEQLGIKGDRVAIELNRDIVPRAKWAEAQLHEGDKLEMVHFVGGGSDWKPQVQRDVAQTVVALLVAIGVAVITFVVVDEIGTIKNGGAQALADNGVALAGLGVLALTFAGCTGLVSFVAIIVWYSFKNRRTETRTHRESGFFV
jgi:sulfur carrier protein